MAHLRIDPELQGLTWRIVSGKNAVLNQSQNNIVDLSEIKYGIAIY